MVRNSGKRERRTTRPSATITNIGTARLSRQLIASIERERRHAEGPFDSAEHAYETLCWIDRQRSRRHEDQRPIDMLITMRQYIPSIYSCEALLQKLGLALYLCDRGVREEITIDIDRPDGSEQLWKIEKTDNQIITVTVDNDVHEYLIDHQSARPLRRNGIEP